MVLLYKPTAWWAYRHSDTALSQNPGAYQTYTRKLEGDHGTT